MKAAAEIRLKNRDKLRFMILRRCEDRKEDIRDRRENKKERSQDVTLILIRRTCIDTFMEIMLINHIVPVCSSIHSANCHYQPSTHANINGATIVASLSTIYFGVLISSLPQVIFSLGTAPE